MQELEGLQPSEIQASYYTPDGRLTSASQYVAMLLEISNNAFAKGRSSVPDEEAGCDTLYHLHLFHEFAKKWSDPSLDQGPFVVVHGNLEPYNLVVSDSMSIVSVLDWEWSRVVPRQFFIPPLWLDFFDPTMLAYKVFYDAYLEKFERFLAIVRTRELERFGEPLLADEWAAAKQNSGFLVANALENWTDMDWFAHRYVNRRWFRGQDEKGLKDRVEAFMNEDPARRALITAKLDEGRAHQADVERIKKGSGATSPLVAPKHTWARLPGVTWGAIAAVLFAGTYWVGGRIVRSHLRRHN
ncbi:hypothetical protein OQA88_9132 [Cercophora sp. LCS_1]